MRFLLHVSFPPEKFNRAVHEGKVGQTIQKIIEETKPEAVYFCAENGKRGAYLAVNMEHASEMPKYAEPWFLSFDATVEFMPTMTPADLKEAGIEEIGKRWK